MTHTPITDQVREHKDDYLGVVEDLELSHADLLAAAEACFATVSYPAPEGGAWWRLTQKEVDMLRTAIAKAKGGD